ncbi:MAG: HD family hydrolase [Anaerolineae bacterium]
MNADSALAFLLRVNQLKLVPRTGWFMRGIADAESVSDHSFGVAFIALILAQIAEEPVDTTKLLTMALLHDLPEVVLGDIPSPASQHLSPTIKTSAERGALSALLDKVPEGETWQTWWREYEEQSSIEGKLVGDADRLDVLLQAFVYEQTTGNRWLKEFWLETSRAGFACDAARALFDALRAARDEGKGVS